MTSHKIGSFIATIATIATIAVATAMPISSRKLKDFSLYGCLYFEQFF